MESIYLVYRMKMCVSLSLCLSVCPADFEIGVSNLPLNHTTLLGMMTNNVNIKYLNIR